jgi:hypothetical protein
MADTKLYDIYLRAYIAMRAREAISEAQDLNHHTDAGHGRFSHIPYSSKELAAFAMGVADGTAANVFPRAEDEFMKQLNRLAPSA